MAEFKCPECGTINNYPEEHLGRKGLCSKCRHIFKISPEHAASEPGPLENVAADQPPLFSETLENRTEAEAKNEFPSVGAALHESGVLPPPLPEKFTSPREEEPSARSALARDMASFSEAQSGADWYVAIGSSPVGPLSLEEMAELASTGNVLTATPVWRPGMDEWTTAEKVDEFTEKIELRKFSPWDPESADSRRRRDTGQFRSLEKEKQPEKEEEIPFASEAPPWTEGIPWLVVGYFLFLGCFMIGVLYFVSKSDKYHFSADFSPWVVVKWLGISIILAVVAQFIYLFFFVWPGKKAERSRRGRRRRR